MARRSGRRAQGVRGGSSVVRPRFCEGVVRIRARKCDAVRAHGSRGARVSAQVSKCVVVETNDTEGRCYIGSIRHAVCCKGSTRYTRECVDQGKHNRRSNDTRGTQLSPRYDI